MMLLAIVFLIGFLLFTDFGRVLLWLGLTLIGHLLPFILLAYFIVARSKS